MTTPLLLDLNKSFELNLDKVGIQKIDIPNMEVRLAVDKSGSMSHEFQCGFVDAIVSRFLGVAMSFDDNSSVEVGFFNHEWHDAPDATPQDVGNYLQKARERADGGTNFAGIIKAFETEREGTVQQAAAQAAGAAKSFFGKLFGATAPASQPAVVPNARAYAAVITDGDNGDKSMFEAELARTSGKVFYQFICIGTSAPASYLRTLAQRYSHVSVMVIPYPDKVTHDDFYEQLVNQKFVDWLKQ